MRKEEIKHTAVIAKNDVAKKIMNEMMDMNVIAAKEVDSRFVLKGNKRAIIYKFHTAKARKSLGMFFGLKHNGKDLGKSKWYHYIAAFFIIVNIKISRNKRFVSLLFKLPKKLIYLYMLFIRFLINY